MTLKASNGESPDAVLIFVLTMLPQFHTHEWGADWKKNADDHWKECECGEKNSYAAHTPGSWLVDKAATATEDGSRHRTCSVCGYVETQAIPATGVTPVKTIFNTRYEATTRNWLLFIFLFGWVWMWF